MLSSDNYFSTSTTTEGCATNLVENASYGNLLDSNGMKRTRNPDEADVIIVNTCAYTTDQENRSVSVIESFKKKDPRQQIIVGGCLTKIAPERVKTLDIHSLFSPGDVEELAKSLDLKESEDSEKNKMVNFFNNNDFKNLTFQLRLLLKLRPVFCCNSPSRLCWVRDKCL